VDTVDDRQMAKRSRRSILGLGRELINALHRLLASCCGVSVAADWYITPGHLSGACRSRSFQRAWGAVRYGVGQFDARKIAMVAFVSQKIVDVTVRRRDAGCQLRYLPQATEEDHGA
jgi:hypothetical protein